MKLTIFLYMVCLYGCITVNVLPEKQTAQVDTVYVPCQKFHLPEFAHSDLLYETTPGDLTFPFISEGMPMQLDTARIKILH